EAAGADMLFVEAPHSVDELRAIASSFRVPLVANMVEGGSTPLLPNVELEAMGFKLVLHAGTLMRAAALAVEEAPAHLPEHGSAIDFQHRVISFQERNRVTDLDGMQSWADQFTPTTVDAH